MYRDKSYWEFQSKKKKIFSKEICMANFLGDCNGNIKKAHTLSKQKSIIPIVENGKFYVRGYNNSIHIIEGGFSNTAGVKNVTTFYGFCNKHDTELFSIFENKEFVYTKKQCCMLLFRSLSKELYLKKAFLKTLEEGEKVQENKINKYKIGVKHFLGLSDNIIKEDKNSIRKQLIQQEKERSKIQELKKDTNLAVKDLESKLKRVKEQIQYKNYNSIRYLIIKLPFIIDLSFDTGFTPEAEKQEELNKEHFDLFVVTTLFEKNSSFVCFIWNKGQEFCHEFVKKLEKENNIKKVLYSFAFSDARELIIKKSWWDSLSKIKQNNINKKIYSNYFGNWQEKNIEIIKNF